MSVGNQVRYPWPCFCPYSVRERDNKTFALSMSYKRETKHYKIEKHRASGGEKLAIEDGPRFDSLMDVSNRWLHLWWWKWRVLEVVWICNIPWLVPVFVSTGLYLCLLVSQRHYVFRLSIFLCMHVFKTSLLVSVKFVHVISLEKSTIWTLGGYKC